MTLAVAAQLRPHCFNLLLVLFAVIGAALILVRQMNYGVALSPDSINYIAVARNLLAGDGFIDFRGVLYITFPPLYPMLLATAGLLTFDPHDVAGPLNAAVFGLTVFIAGSYLHQRLESRFLDLWGCLAIILSVILCWVASYAWSEATFILLATLSLIQTDRYLDQGKSSSLLWAAVFAALACLTRYIGCTLMVTVAALLLFQRGVTPLEKMKRLSAYSFIALAPISLWFLRNFLLTGTFAGEMSTLDYSWSALLRDATVMLGNTLSHSLIWVGTGPWTAILGGLVLFALIVAIGCISIQGQRKPEVWIRWRSFYVFSSFALIYICMLIILIKVSGRVNHGMQLRFLAPTYIPLLFAVVFSVDRFLTWERRKKLLGSVGNLPDWAKFRTISRLAVTLGLCLWLVWTGALNLSQINYALTKGISYYNSATWVRSETLQYIRRLPFDGAVLYSNAPYILYFHTRKSATFRSLPQPSRTKALSVEGSCETLLSSWFHRRLAPAVEDIYMVWLHKHTDELINYSVADLRRLPWLEATAELADGVILKVNKAYSSDGANSATTSATSRLPSNHLLAVCISLLSSRPPTKPIHRVRGRGHGGNRRGPKQPCARQDGRLSTQGQAYRPRVDWPPRGCSSGSLSVPRP